VIKNDFKRGQVNTTLFRRTLEIDILVVQIYVDDIIFGSTNASLWKEFSKLMQNKFEMSMIRELKFFLGIQINQSKDGVYIHQTKYTKELLKKFKLEDCKVMNTPMHPICTLSKEDTGSKVYQKLYRAVIGSLLYITASRPDISFSVCLCARFQSDPRESHLTVDKRIFKYLKGTKNLGLLYRKSLDYKLVGFCDADYIGDRIERKSITVSSWERIWYPGLAKDKQLLLCLQQKQSKSQLQVVVHNYFGWNISWKTIRLMLKIFPFSVIILLLFVCQKIQLYIQEPSILKSNTILL